MSTLWTQQARNINIDVSHTCLYFLGGLKNSKRQGRINVTFMSLDIDMAAEMLAKDVSIIRGFV